MGDEIETSKHLRAPIWFNVKKKVEFDESTIETRHSRITPQDSSVPGLNNAQLIQFSLNPAVGQIYHLSSKKSALFVRGKFAIGNSNIR